MQDPLTAAQVSDSEPQIALSLPLDADHGIINLLIPALAVITGIIGYAITLTLLNAAQADLNTLIGLLPFAVGFVGIVGGAIAADYFLRRIIPPHRVLIVETETLSIKENRTGTETTLRWDQHINVQAWRFTVKRGSARTPRGSIMLAIQLQQDETILTLYTFMTSKQAETVPNYALFTPLLPRAEITKGKLNLRETADQRRLLKAEDLRWEAGAALRRNDFPVVLQAIFSHVKDWQKVK